MLTPIRLFNTLSGRARAARAASAARARLLRLRSDRLQPRARRQLPDLRGDRRAAAHAHALRLPRARGHERDRRGRPHHPAGPGGGPGPRELHGAAHPRLRGGHEDAAHGAAGARAAGHRAHPGDDRAHRAPDRARAHLHRGRLGLLPHRAASRSTAGSRASTSRGSRPGARVDSDKYDKENARDFVLWKLKSDEPAWAQWEAPFGRGRPGWHIECSAMSMKYLGETFDLHAGGVDLIFPHHENEIAQSAVRHRQALRAPLAARQAPADRQRDDVEEQGQLRHDPDAARAGPLGRRRSATRSPARTTASRSTSASRR